MSSIDSQDGLPSPRFVDRADAGRFLAAKLAHYAHEPDLLVLALPRGGVPVAYQVARSLGAPMDVFLVRKLGVPGHEELAMGAIASGSVCVLNEQVVQSLGLSSATIAAAVDREQQELIRRDRQYRGDASPPAVSGKVIILVDDGLATGSTMRAAVTALRPQNPRRIVVAVPTGAADTCEQLRAIADEVICAETPEGFWAVGLSYEDFLQTSDAEVRELLARRREEITP